MRDRDIRRALHHKVLSGHHGESSTLVIDELGLRHGICRVDIAVVNGFIHGYEIKSDADTLDRLTAQVSVYSAVLDRATLVVGEKHILKAKIYLPDWWGIKVVSVGQRGGIEFNTIRRYKNNPSIEPVALAELLWRPEVVGILRKLGTPEPLLRKPRTDLYGYLAEIVDLSSLRDLVRRALKSRVRWRDQQPLS